MGKQLPNNWIETGLKTIVLFNKGKKPKRLELQDFQDAIPYMDIMALEKSEVSQYADLTSSKIFKDEDIAIVWDGARSGWVAKAQPGAIGSTIAALSPIKINNHYLYYFLLQVYPEVNSKARGVGIPHVDPVMFWAIPVPLAPLAEQERIAEKLDALFGQLDSVRGAMSRIPTLIANLRQQILTHAVTGKLTEKWRKNKKLSEWKTERADECCIKVQSGGTPKGSNFSSTGIPFLKVYNIVQNKINFEYQPQYVTDEVQNTQIKKSITYPGDVIMNIVGPPLNKIAIIPNTYPEWNINQAITMFRVKDYLLKEYLYYFFCEGSSVNSLINETRGVVGQVNISLSQCRAFPINIPQKSEQEKIVQQVKSLFDKLDSIESQYSILKQKIDNLPQAILHKAFKGELVEQLPSDGNAADLLWEIEQLKRSFKKTKNGTQY